MVIFSAFIILVGLFGVRRMAFPNGDERLNPSEADDAGPQFLKTCESKRKMMGDTFYNFDRSKYGWNETTSSSASMSSAMSSAAMSFLERGGAVTRKSSDRLLAAGSGEHLLAAGSGMTSWTPASTSLRQEALATSLRQEALATRAVAEALMEVLLLKSSPLLSSPTGKIVWKKEGVRTSTHSGHLRESHGDVRYVWTYMNA